ncbi:MAG: hypothetical protein AB1646_05920 [Thermodesulfobacteriota bacterium]
MAETSRPDVTGKGPAFIRETLEVFKEINGKCGSLSAQSAEKIQATLGAKAAEIEPILSRAYMKTVKAGETAYSCKELTEGLMQCAANGNEAEAMAKLAELEKEMDGLIHKVKTFVVRMT